MCGIVGFNWCDSHLLASMMKVIEHRGPDESGTFIDKDISLGHQRLKIIDLSSGKQPIHNENENLQIIFNGEIYNFIELRVDLEKKGHKFYTNTDSEVIIHLFEEYGTSCIKYLNGMFAFAIYDSTNKTLFLARDRIGKKPLYYWYDKGRIIFASEIKAILQFFQIPLEINIEAFKLYLQFRYVPIDETLISGIKKLQPSHWLLFQEGQISINKYWNIQQLSHNYSDEHYISEFLKLYKSAVDCRLVSDVPLGVYLSGGLDSASIVALMSESIDSINTFSVGFESSPDSELPYARKVAEQFGTSHHEFTVEDKDIRLIPKMVWHLDEPIGDAATLPTMILSKYAKKYVSVVLAGEGGDEILSGYDNQRIMMKCWKFHPIIKPFKKIFSHIQNYCSPDSNIHKILSTLSSQNFEVQYFTLNRLFMNNELKQLGISDSDITQISKFFPKTQMNHLNRIQYYGINTWLPHDFCMKADKMTMAYGIEERAPLLDYRLAEFAFSLPNHLKINNNAGKIILKKSMNSYLPRDIIYRKKHGYNAPMDNWLKDNLKEVLNSLIEENEHQLYQKQYVYQLFEKFQNTGLNYKANFWNAQKLWSILVFEIWYRIFIERVNYDKILL
jgi:asparagine synthase (glutamine-hydrolysing)